MGVIGNPCQDAGKIPYEAPEVRCDGNTLIGAPISDHRHVIIAMFFDDEEQYANRAYQEPEFKEHCDERARMGYNSGMGGNISPRCRHQPCQGGAANRPVKAARIVMAPFQWDDKVHHSMEVCLALAATRCNKCAVLAPAPGPGAAMIPTL